MRRGLSGGRIVRLLCGASPAIVPVLARIRYRSYGGASLPLWVYLVGGAVVIVIAVAFYFLKMRGSGGKASVQSMTDFVGLGGRGGQQQYGDMGQQYPGQQGYPGAGQQFGSMGGPAAPMPPGGGMAPPPPPVMGVATSAAIITPVGPMPGAPNMPQPPPPPGAPGGVAAPSTLPSARGGMDANLTPGEAAALLWDDASWVGAVSLFHLLQMGLIQIHTAQPPLFQRVENVPPGLPTFYAAFLGAFRPDGSPDPAGMKNAVDGIESETAQKVHPHATQMTVEYYQKQATEAWDKVRQAQDPAAKMQAFHESLPMLLLDSSFVEDTQSAFASGDYPMPPWVLNLARVMGRQPSISAIGGGLSLSGPDFAQCIAGGFMVMKNAAHTAAGAQ